MGFSPETYAVARKYTDDTVAGAGAVAGKPCQIQSITDITGGHRVTFLWVDNSSVSHTSTMDVMDGEKGDDGLGIKSVAVNSSNHLIVTYDDDTTEDAGEVTLDTSDFVQKSSTAGLLKNDGTVDTNTYVTAVSGKGLSTNDYDNTAKTKLDDLANIKSVGTGLSLNGSTGELTATGGGGGTWGSITGTLSDQTDLQTALDGKQATLTFDNVPTNGSNNPVKSDGIYDALSEKADITSIAPEENGATASRAYKIGEHFYKNGKFCTVISAIASGATLTLNTNYTEGTIADTVMGYVKIATAAKNQTWAEQLAQLKTVWDTYSRAQKVRIHLFWEDYIILYANNSSVYGFVGVTIKAGGYYQYTIRIAGSNYIVDKYTFESNGTFTYDNLRDVTNTSVLSLIMI